MSGRRERWFPRPMGRVSARIKGASNALRQWGDSAYAASTREGVSDQFQAAMRGKAAAYREAAEMLEAIHAGTRLPRRWGGDGRKAVQSETRIWAEDDYCRDDDDCIAGSDHEGAHRYPSYFVTPKEVRDAAVVRALETLRSTNPTQGVIEEINKIEAEIEVCQDDQRKAGQRFCGDCPDHEGCMTGYPCNLVKTLFKTEVWRKANPGLSHDHTEHVKGCFRCDLSAKESE